MDKNYDIIFTGLAQNCEIHIDKFFKIYNEIPTIILILVIFVVVFKPL